MKRQNSELLQKLNIDCDNTLQERGDAYYEELKKYDLRSENLDFKEDDLLDCYEDWSELDNIN